MQFLKKVLLYRRNFKKTQESISRLLVVSPPAGLGNASSPKEIIPRPFFSHLSGQKFGERLRNKSRMRAIEQEAQSQDTPEKRKSGFDVLVAPAGLMRRRKKSAFLSQAIDQCTHLPKYLCRQIRGEKSAPCQQRQLCPLLFALCNLEIFPSSYTQMYSAHTFATEGKGMRRRKREGDGSSSEVFCVRRRRRRH